MKIAYGVMGYDRGHAMRTAAVLPGLMTEHEVRVFAGGGASRAIRHSRRQQTKASCATWPAARA